jgi:hypothetical protein
MSDTVVDYSFLETIDNRWIDSSAKRIFEPEKQCLYCGTFAGGTRDQFGRRACPTSTCLACGSELCLFGSGSECKRCFVGLIPGWSGNTTGCQRVRCEKQAVKIVRRRKVCATHGGPSPVQEVNFHTWVRAQDYFRKIIDLNAAAHARREAGTVETVRAGNSV